MQFSHAKKKLWKTVLTGNQVISRERYAPLKRRGGYTFDGGITLFRLTANKEIRDWCNANCQSHWFITHESSGLTVTINFTSDRDAALFKLFFG